MPNGTASPQLPIRNRPNETQPPGRPKLGRSERPGDVGCPCRARSSSAIWLRTHHPDIKSCPLWSGRSPPSYTSSALRQNRRHQREAIGGRRRLQGQPGQLGAEEFQDVPVHRASMFEADDLDATESRRSATLRPCVPARDRSPDWALPMRPNRCACRHPADRSLGDPSGRAGAFLRRRRPAPGIWVTDCSDYCGHSVDAPR